MSDIIINEFCTICKQAGLTVVNQDDRIATAYIQSRMVKDGKVLFTYWDSTCIPGITLIEFYCRLFKQFDGKYVTTDDFNLSTLKKVRHPESLKVACQSVMSEITRLESDPYYRPEVCLIRTCPDWKSATTEQRQSLRYYYRTVTFVDKYEYANSLSLNELEALRLDAMRTSKNPLKTYPEYRDSHKKPEYFGCTCFVGGCNKPAEYEGGDARYYCGMCEEHANVKRDYLSYLCDYAYPYVTAAVRPYGGPVGKP